MRKMYKFLIAAFVVVVGTTFIVSTASAANGACGGGQTLSQAIKGWKGKGVLDDVARLTGQKPGLDGSAESIVRKGIVKTIVVKGGWVKNFTCSGGKFKPVSGKKYIPAGATYWVPEKNAPAPCKKKRVRTGMQDGCGNKQIGNLLVKRPCSKKKSKPTPKKPTTVTPSVVCPAGTTAATVNSGIACQSNNASVDNTTDVKNDCKGPNSNSSQCNTVVTNITNITQINANCSKLVFSDGRVEIHDNNGNTVTESYCSQVTLPCTANCNVTVVCPPGTTGVYPNCQTPPTKSIVITSMTDLNDIPTGKSSGPYYVEVSASDTGGTLTVDPGIGSLTDCNGGSREGSKTVAVPKGITKLCFVIWAPSDPAKPTTMSVTATATLGSSVSQKVDTLGITYPVRP